MSRSREVDADNVLIPFQAIYPGTSQKVTVSGSHAESNAVGANTTIIRLVSDTDCFIAIAAAPTASATSSMFLKAGVPEYFGCKPVDKVSVLQATAGGTLYITEGA